MAIRGFSAIIHRCAWVGLALAAAPFAHAQDWVDIQRRIAAGEFGPITSLVVERHGQTRFESYYRGASAEQVQLLNSVTKSVAATMVGIAARRGELSVNAGIETFFPNFDFGSPPLQQHRGMTLKHVLQMRHGLAWDELSTSFLDPRNPVARMLASPDYALAVLSTPRAAPAGTRFTYSTGASTLMSGVLRHASGRSPQAFAQERLFAPLGITDSHWETWSPGGRGTGISAFPGGDAPLGIGLWLRPRDLVRIGRLWLHGGVADGQRLLDPDFVRAAWTVQSDRGTDPGFDDGLGEAAGYGWQWWYREFRDRHGRSHPSWYASGYGGQRLYVFPELDLIVASTADSTRDHVGPGLATVLREHVLPALDRSIDSDVAGTWVEPGVDGQGLAVEVPEPGTVIAYWFTHDSGGQRWYVLVGDVVDDVAHLTATRVEGAGFRATAAPVLRPAGTATLRWLDCRRARLDYAVEAGSGVIELQRLTGRCPDRARGEGLGE